MPLHHHHFQCVTFKEKYYTHDEEDVKHISTLTIEFFLIIIINDIRSAGVRRYRDGWMIGLHYF